MKRFLALSLTAVMLVGILAGCAKKDPNDKGAIITMYLAADPSNTNLDPAKMLYNAESVKFIGLLFEGLMKYDENGKVVKGMADSYSIKEDTEKGIYQMIFELKYSRWNDSRVVSADDFVYAWKRILEPEFSSPGTALLYPIKNARAVKQGDKTIDDLGVSADGSTLEITFEGDTKPNYDLFLENLASISLVPVREDTITPDPEGWASKPLTLLTNGPFTMKTMEYSKEFVMERSTYYLLEDKKNKDIFKYVEPFRIQLIYNESLAKLENRYSGNDKVFFLGSVPLDKYNDYKDTAVKKDLLSTYVYYFNENNDLFKKAEVRQALSIALNRNKIAELASLGVKPATGLVPTGVKDTKVGTDFREKAGDIIKAEGDIATAKSLLQKAGVTSGSFTLKYRNVDSEKLVAEYAAGVWKELGFNVTLTEIKGKAVNETLFQIGDATFDVIGVDYQALTADAFSVLAPFSTGFGGTKIEFLNEGESFVYPNIVSFKDDRYDTLMEEAFAETDVDKRAEKLREIEKLFVELSPAAPLYFNTSLNITKDVSGLKYSKFGYTDFSKAKLKDYLQYTTEPPTFAPAADTVE